MEIWHRGHLGTECKAFLSANDIRHWPVFADLAKTEVRKLMFEIAESNPAWQEVKARLKGEHTYIHTKFSSSDIAQAEWCIVSADYSIQNVRKDGYAWSSEYIFGGCKACGTGWRQMRPFHIKKEPTLGRNAFASFGSAFELFAIPAVSEVFKGQGITGVDVWPIIVSPQNRPSERLQQLIVTETAGPAIVEELVERERYYHRECPVCGRTWHAHYTRGILPLRRNSLIPDADFQTTWEWFGNGRTARREILISKRVINLILRYNWQGIELIPILAVT